MTKTWTIALRSDLFKVGINDFGDVEGEVGYLVAFDEDGNAWYHDARFALTRNGITEEEGWAYARRDEEAWTKAEAFEKKVQAAADAGTWAGPVNNPHWIEGEPAYGSNAYAKNWQYWGYHAMDAEEQEGYCARFGGAPTFND